ncbi:hypothetical protein HY620_01235 [Candidatus Uhrbacteria bacterium]|nr:hypothetical protein [Candidatus Uhrbacteria bacterium]
MIFSKLYLQLFFRDPFLLVSTILALVGNMLNWAFIVWRYDILVRPEREFISLHYKVFLGPDFYGPWQYIFFIPALLLIIMLLNYSFARRLYHFQRMSTYALSTASVFCQACALLATHLIITINIF